MFIFFFFYDFNLDAFPGCAAEQLWRYDDNTSHEYTNITTTTRSAWSVSSRFLDIRLYHEINNNQRNNKKKNFSHKH